MIINNLQLLELPLFVNNVSMEKGVKHAKGSSKNYFPNPGRMV